MKTNVLIVIGGILLTHLILFITLSASGIVWGTSTCGKVVILFYLCGAALTCMALAIKNVE